MIPRCLTLSIIRYVSRVKWGNSGKGAALSPTARYRSYWKGSFRVTNFTYFTIQQSMQCWWASIHSAFPRLQSALSVRLRICLLYLLQWGKTPTKKKGAALGMTLNCIWSWDSSPWDLAGELPLYYSDPEWQHLLESHLFVKKSVLKTIRIRYEYLMPFVNYLY